MICVKTTLANMPTSCKECDFFEETLEEDSFGEYWTSNCIFGCSSGDFLLKRPANCPLIEVKQN